MSETCSDCNITCYLKLEPSLPSKSDNPSRETPLHWLLHGPWKRWEEGSVFTPIPAHEGQVAVEASFGTLTVLVLQQEQLIQLAA